jgi:hypothetical protein
MKFTLRIGGPNMPSASAQNRAAGISWARSSDRETHLRTKNLPKALSYVESKLPPKAGLDGRRVFIGEYGFAARHVPEKERDRRSRQVMRVGLQWGCPFVLCWQMYNNEFSDGQQNGYWLIDDKGVKQPLWHTHHEFYRKSRRYVVDFRQKKGRMPTSEEFRRFALGILDADPQQAE